MRIAFYSTILHYPWGGADTLWTRAAEEAAERGDALWISVAEGVARHPRIAALARRGAHLVARPADPPATTGPARLRRKLVALARPARTVVEALRQFRPDLVVVSCGGAYDLLIEPDLRAWLGGAAVPYRVIVNWQSEHPHLDEKDWAAMAACLPRADRLVFVSERNRAVTRRHLLDPLPNAEVLHNPLRCSDWEAVPWPAAPPWRLATVGRLEAVKGIDLLLHAASLALATEPDWRLDIFGRGPAEPFLRRTAAHLGLADRVTFRGHVDDLRAIWAENHLLVSPARDEGVPMTIPEALLCGRPVLATAVGGAEDWIDPDRTGFLCPAPTLPLLAQDLRAAWTQRAHWSDRGRAGAAAARAHYRPRDAGRLITL